MRRPARFAHDHPASGRTSRPPMSCQASNTPSQRVWSASWLGWDQPQNPELVSETGDSGAYVLSSSDIAVRDAEPTWSACRHDASRSWVRYPVVRKPGEKTSVTCPLFTTTLRGTSRLRPREWPGLSRKRESDVS